MSWVAPGGPGLGKMDVIWGEIVVDDGIGRGLVLDGGEMVGEGHVGRGRAGS